MSHPEPGSAAEMYEQYFVPAMFVPWANILLRHASPQPGERVLDVAWAELHQEELLANWRLVTSGEEPFKIQPLQ
jgi:hypothetical protein